jgi:hypothetical protein
MLTSLNQVGRNGCLSKRFARLEPMQPLYQHKPLAVRSHKNGRFLPLVQHALCQGCQANRRIDSPCCLTEECYRAL